MSKAAIDRSNAPALRNEELSARQRAAITAVCTDMHRPYLNAVGAVLKHAEVVFDEFHVLQHASAALDEVRRQEFFRAGAVMRAHGRGKRWLLLRRWKTVRRSKRAELQALFAANRRLFKAYVLREQLDRLWTYKTPAASWTSCLAGSRRFAGNGCPRWNGSAIFSSSTSKGSPPTAITRFASVSLNRSTRPSKPYCAALAGEG